MKADLRWAAAFLLLPTSLVGEKRLLKTLYCAPGGAGRWHMQDYHPLINIRTENSFAEVWMLDGHVERFRLRQFHPGRETRFVYRFNPNGKLLFVEGSVEVWNKWVAQATLPSTDRNGDLPTEIHYFKTRTELGAREDQIPTPSGAERYLRDLTSAPVYTTTSELPCAEDLRDLEKLNAAQK